MVVVVCVCVRFIARQLRVITTHWLVIKYVAYLQLDQCQVGISFLFGSTGGRRCRSLWRASVINQWTGKCQQASRWAYQLTDTVDFRLKVKSTIPHEECRWGAHLPYLRPWAHRVINHLNLWRMATVMPDLWYLRSHRKLLPCDQYQIILLGDKGTCVSKPWAELTSCQQHSTSLRDFRLVICKTNNT